MLVVARTRLPTTTPALAKSAVTMANEDSVPEFAVPCSRAWALGWHAGEQKWFKARIVQILPRIHVAFEEDEFGSAHKLALPEMDAYVAAYAVRPPDW